MLKRVGYRTAYLHNGEFDFERMESFLVAHPFRLDADPGELTELGPASPQVAARYELAVARMHRLFARVYAEYAFAPASAWQ